MRGHLYLVGYRGTGKSTVGRLLADALGRPFVDLDERIEAAAGRSIAAIFADEGEAGFRDREATVLSSWEFNLQVVLRRSESSRSDAGSGRSSGLEDSPRPGPHAGNNLKVELQQEPADSHPLLASIVATGAGIVLREENRRFLKSTGFTVWLRAPAEILWARLQADAGTAARRPNLTTGGLAEIVELLAVRERFYREVADATIDAGGASPEAVAAAILTTLRALPSD